MFGLLRSLLSPAHEEAPHSLELSVRSHVTFGRMAQKTLSQLRVELTAARTYTFDGESFVAYHMEIAGVHHQMILSGTERDESYLALSQQLNPRIFPLIFTDYTPEHWFDLDVGASVEVAQSSFGVLSGWLTSSYTLVMHTHGRLSAGESDDTQIFDYALLTDERNRFALEAERYADGTLRVFATVYVPATNIVRTEAAPTLVLIEKAEQEVIESEKPVEIPVQEEQPILIEEVQAQEEVPAYKDTPMQSAAAHSESELLVCDVQLAGRIIDEATRNKMGLEDLIRKVIDLPAHIHEEVWIPFHLSDAEYAVLAERYALSADAHGEIRQKIMEELSQFAGVRKKK